VTFEFADWEDKHPVGRLSSAIGPVDVLDNFYEYQLYCKSLNASIQKFQKDTSKAIGKGDHEDFINSIKVKFPCIEDRTNIKDWYIFTIDPPKSQDFDDGFSIRVGENGIQQISIYIANVTIWMDVLNLWDSFSQRISTIYLPDKKRPMLPTILSDCLCSLQEKVTRVAFVMDVFIKDNAIIDVKYGNCLIKVARNFCYEEASLLRNEKYTSLLDITKNLSQKNRYISSVKNSHDVVCYLMILMNYYCATEMLKHKTGIFRSTIMKRECSVPDSVPEDVAKFIKIWNSASGQYIDGTLVTNSDTGSMRHELLDMDAYIHITSPIRRLVDLLNMIKIQSILGLVKLSENVDKFYEKWLRDLEYINTTMRSIRKVQCDCTLLDLCANNTDVIDKEYDGYIFDKINRNDGLFQYIVFLPELKLSSRITLRDDFENFESRKFKLFLFNDEESFKRKIRLHLV
jgi:exoribonuclease R